MLFGLVVARHIGLGRLAAVAPLALLVAAIVLWARRFTAIGLFLRYLGFAPLLFLGLFLFASPSGRLISPRRPRDPEGVTIGVEAPVVFVVLDEVPIASLMKPDGSIDRSRFPGFARLAESSTWYRNATSISPFTHDSLPAILTGKEPKEGDLPTSADHPENLFTLLGGEVPLDVTEAVTEFCPSELCDREVAGFGDHMTRMISDASVVDGHLTLPRRFRLGLPPVDDTWGGFVEGAGDLGQPAERRARPARPETIDEFMLRRDLEKQQADGGATRGVLLATRSTRCNWVPRRCSSPTKSFPTVRG